MHSSLLRRILAVVVVVACTAVLIPAAVASAAPSGKGKWSLVAGKPRSVRFTVSFSVKTVGFNIKLPASVKADNVTAPSGFQCQVTFFLLVMCHGTLAANHSAKGTVVLKAKAKHHLGGQLHGFTGGPGIDATVTGP
jgi:hypothetical protein